MLILLQQTKRPLKLPGFQCHRIGCFR